MGDSVFDRRRLRDLRLRDKNRRVLPEGPAQRGDADPILDERSRVEFFNIRIECPGGRAAFARTLCGRRLLGVREP